MALFNSGDNKQKQKKKQAEKILNKKLVGGILPTSVRIAFFNRMMNKGIKGAQQEKVRMKVLKIIKNEVENGELEPELEEIDKRIDEILDEYSDPETLEKRKKSDQEALEKREAKKLIKKSEIEKKFGVDLTDKQWFQCSIEEIKYSTFTNQKQRNIDTAYVIINDDNFEIIKESVWIKSNMGTRKIFFGNITSIDFDSSGRLHLSSSVIINTKSAEHIQLKFVSRENFNLLNNAFESYFRKTNSPQEKIQTSDADELLKYAELLEKGLLTKEEFDMKKSEILSGEPVISKQLSSVEEITQEELKSMVCPNCESEIDGDSKFCPECGFKI